MGEIVESFVSEFSVPSARKGLPLGNLTSQLFANVYLNEFDQFARSVLKVRHYVRYSDDFVIVANDLPYLKGVIVSSREFLAEKLKLELHPNKVTIRKFGQGIDFLGYVILPHHRMLRAGTRRRAFASLKIRAEGCRDGLAQPKAAERSLQSYLGVLSHADTHRLREDLRNRFWFWLGE